MGLSPSAKDILYAPEKGITVHYLSGNKLVGREEVDGCLVPLFLKKEKSGDHYEGMFGVTYPLFKYVFQDGREVAEAVQAEVWDAGPNFYLALKDNTGEWIEKSFWDGCPKP